MTAPPITGALTLLLLWPVMLWQRLSTTTTILGQGLEECRRVNDSKENRRKDRIRIWAVLVTVGTHLPFWLKADASQRRVKV